MAHIDATATHDGNGNVTLDGYTATYSAGNVTLTPASRVIAEDEISLSLVDTSEYATKAELNVTADSITQTVSSTYTTKTEFNNLEVGGRNLLRNTQTFDEWVGDDNVTVADGVITWAATSTLAWNTINSGNFPIKYSEVRGKELTLSLDVKSDEYESLNSETNRGLLVSFQLFKENAANRNVFRDISFRNHELSDEWQRIVYTFTASDLFFTTISGDGVITPSTDNFVVGLYNYSLYSMEVRHVKLEKGNKATDWTPAPEDMATEADLTAAETRITQTENSITSQAKEITSLGTRMSTVEQTASGLTVRLNEVEEEAADAAKTATNFLSYDSTDGLLIGNKSSGAWEGFRTQVTSTAFNVLNSAGETLASYGAKLIELGKNAADAVIEFCGGKGSIQVETEDDVDYLSIKSDHLRLYGSQEADIWSANSITHSDHMTWGKSWVKTIADGDGGASVELYAESCTNADLDGVGTTEYSYLNVGSVGVGCFTGEINLSAKYDVSLSTVSGDISLVSSVGDIILDGNYTKTNCLHITGTTDASGTADNNAPLIIGSRSGYHLVFDGNEIMAKASGTTTSGLNLNTDGGIVNVRGNPIYGAKILYNNSSGNSGTVTLSETAANFTYLEIYTKYSDSVYAGYLKVYSPNGKTVDVSSANATSGGGGVMRTRCKISGTSITQSYNYSTNLNGTSSTPTHYITQVIGYK